MSKYSIKELEKELEHFNKKENKKLSKLIKKYRIYDKFDILIELSKKRIKI